jgi:saccharopine dehydrogenase (NADP+, L-glutamate forming)
VLEKKKQFEKGERDLVVLQHKSEIEHRDGKKEARTSTPCEYGVPGEYSAIARLIGIPPRLLPN